MKFGIALGAGALTVSLTVIGSTLGLLSGCGKQEQAVVPPPTVVTVSRPIERKVADYFEFTGNTSAYATVDIRARVKGFLKKTEFADGALVTQGELLFEIEPDIFQAQVDSAKAELEAAKAQLQKAEADLAIKQEMAAGNAASKLDVIQAQASVYIATAQVQLTTAQLEQANINLGYTKIYSPLAGRIDKSAVSAGNLVGADGNTLLATVVQGTPMYCYFNVDEATVQLVHARMQAKGLALGIKAPPMAITLALGDSDDFAFKGVIDYVDNRVNPSTGTVQVRGIFPNEDRVLLAGFFARVRVPNGEPHEARLIPERAIGVDQGQKYVLVVNDKNIVEFRPVETGSLQGRMRVISKGIGPDDWVITEGLLRTRPGAIVAPNQAPIQPVEAADPDSTQPATQPQPE